MRESRSQTSGCSIAFSADSRQLAVVDTDGHTATLLDLESGQPLSDVPLSGSYAWALAFTPDGRGLLVGSDLGVQTVRWSDGATPAKLDTGYDAVAAARDGTIVTFGSNEARTYRDGVPLATMPGIDDFCHGFNPTATLSDDGSTVALGESCSRAFQLAQAPHADIRATATGALIQQLAEDVPALFSRDASMFTSDRGLLWCR